MPSMPNGGKVTIETANCYLDEYPRKTEKHSHD
jgi:hypothetical protein